MTDSPTLTAPDSHTWRTDTLLDTPDGTGTNTGHTDNKGRQTAKSGDDKMIVSVNGILLGPCGQCGREVGTLGWCKGRTPTVGLRCDACKMGWEPLVSISEAEAVARYGTFGG